VTALGPVSGPRVDQGAGIPRQAGQAADEAPIAERWAAPATPPGGMREPASRPGASGQARAPAGARSIDELLADARRGLDRLTPGQASAEVAAGALLVDIRPAAQRAAQGEVPGALIVERNVLEWRFDPASAARLRHARYDLRVIVMCSEGYTSSLAAAALRLLGVRAATDLDGGYRAWAAAGLPARPAGWPSPSDQRELD